MTQTILFLTTKLTTKVEVKKQEEQKFTYLLYLVILQSAKIVEMIPLLGFYKESTQLEVLTMI
ncbi:MAG: hypothetical protein CMF74_01700 [Maricaulis sp.]|nr:hypothetical protein [Maricaulis sp.]